MFTMMGWNTSDLVIPAALRELIGNMIAVPVIGVVLLSVMREIHF